MNGRVAKQIRRVARLAANGEAKPTQYELTVAKDAVGREHLIKLELAKDCARKTSKTLKKAFIQGGMAIVVEHASYYNLTREANNGGEAARLLPAEPDLLSNSSATGCFPGRNLRNGHV